MSIQYAEQKTKQALKEAGGNKAKARRLLIQWIAEDHELLLGLTSVHLNGIIPFWVDRVERKESIQNALDEQTEKAAPKEDPKSFGEQMLRSFAGQRTSTFGLEAGDAPLAKRAASQRHIDAINMIATNNKKSED